MAFVGNGQRRKNTKYVQANERLLNIKNLYINGERNALETCHAMAYFSAL